MKVAELLRPDQVLGRAEAFFRYHRPYVSEASPIIVGGCGRSGTTLMRVILDTHSQICCGPESNIFRQAPARHQFKEFAGRLASRFDISAESVMEMLNQGKSHAEFIDRFFQAYCRSTGKEHWAEKTPRNIHRIRYLFRHFPKAFFIHMIRDGRDTICSLRTHPRHKVVDGKLVETGIRNPLNQCVQRWLQDVRAGLSFRSHPRYIEVRYEDLVLNSEKTLNSLLYRLGFAMEPRLLEFHEVQSTSRDVTRFPQNPEATAPMYETSIGRWQKELSPDEIAFVMKKTGQLLVNLGYQHE